MKGKIIYNGFVIKILMFFLSVILLFSGNSYAFSISNMHFIENNGQLRDNEGNYIKDVLYTANDKGITIYIRKTGLSFIFSTNHKEQTNNTDLNDHKKYIMQNVLHYESYSKSYYRLDLDWIGINDDYQIETYLPSNSRFNYYLSGINKNQLNVNAYQKITFKNIYDCIDLELYTGSSKSGFKYDFIVHPGGDINDIKFVYEGAEDIIVKEKYVKVKTPFGYISDHIPVIFDASNGSLINGNFSRDGRKIGFEIEQDAINSASGPIIIDPEVIWSTYFGGDMGDFITDLKVSDDGFIYMTGFTYSNNGIAKPGSFQDTLNGEISGFLAKLSKEGKLIWSTYFGGEGNDFIEKIAINSQGEIIVSGRTSSSNGLSTPGAHKETGSGIMDVFLAVFDTAGQLQWSTYYGGSESEFLSGLSITSNDHIVIAGYTNSLNEISTDSSFKPYFSGEEDGFIAYFDPFGSLIWATYYGDIKSDNVTNMTIDHHDHIYITGFTSSDTNIATSGAHQEKHGGGPWFFRTDGFLAKFDSTGNLLWGTYYGGNSYETDARVTIDNDNNVILTGNTSSANNISTPGSFQSEYSGVNLDIYIAKFTSDGIRLWGTYVGGDDQDIVTSVVTDSLNRIFIAGRTRNHINMSTPNAFQTEYAGETDGYLASFDLNGHRIWGSYYGGPYTDMIRSIYLKDGYLYFCGITSSNSGIIYGENNHQELYGGGVYDGFLAVLDTSGMSDPVSSIVNPIQAASVNRFKVYPNPVNDKILNLFYNGTSTEVSVSILTLDGKNILDKKIELLNNGYFEIPLHHLPSAVYLLEIKSDMYLQYEKILIE